MSRDTGEPVSGAATQRRPLLILALAALVPDGIPRERLLRALWPDGDRARARATLKQHLYALRRATGCSDLLTGSPRLRVATDLVRVDALELVEHVQRGRLRDAAELLQGELLEDVVVGSNDPLRELLEEIRSAFAPRIALVHKAIAAQRSLPVALPAASRVAASIGAERELAAAARRFVRGMMTLPDDSVGAYHRAAWSSHDLIEALTAAERGRVPAERIRDLIVETEGVWRRSRLVEQMLVDPPGQLGGTDTLDWLMEGGLRSEDPVGRALEAQLLEGGAVAQLRAGILWQARELSVRTIESATPLRALILAPGGARAIQSALPALRRTGAALVINDPGDDALHRVRQRLADSRVTVTPVAGDPFGRVDDLARHGPFDLILLGGLLDQVESRSATWLVEQLVAVLSPGGRICLTSLVTDTPHGPWFRHVVRWTLTERDQDDLLLLSGSAASECEVIWGRDRPGHTWLLTLRREAASHRRSGA